MYTCFYLRKKSQKKILPSNGGVFVVISDIRKCLLPAGRCGSKSEDSPPFCRYTTDKRHTVLDFSFIPERLRQFQVWLAAITIHVYTQ